MLVLSTYTGMYLLQNNFLISESSDLGKGSEMRSDHVVPLTTHDVMFYIELLHLRIENLLPFLKGSVSTS
jgi:hypothetical protein